MCTCVQHVCKWVVILRNHWKCVLYFRCCFRLHRFLFSRFGDICFGCFAIFRRFVYLAGIEPKSENMHGIIQQMWKEILLRCCKPERLLRTWTRTQIHRTYGRDSEREWDRGKDRKYFNNRPISINSRNGVHVRQQDSKTAYEIKKSGIFFFICLVVFISLFFRRSSSHSRVFDAFM